MNIFKKSMVLSLAVLCAGQPLAATPTDELARLISQCLAQSPMGAQTDESSAYLAQCINGELPAAGFPIVAVLTTVACTFAAICCLGSCWPDENISTRRPKGH